ncbi:hypothetical protein [Burkholderia vietnamiensis]|uniref:hypothetical protein n=1 Tax=Burkholderia vietnamiensis TaxID=60552 RepID=UPI000751D79F|nr:hypothetical protein [Burkholderia vietnamiensis]KVE80374.1 hypothetical protein WJ00_02300 [Burkholderia vietnamiensis]KVR83060.1 hypothetical protein WK26_09890 [Burkholderia vietnamiensis]MBR8150023.1 hypothetical protein [Burkholderia vietnamiensis]
MAQDSPSIEYLYDFAYLDRGRIDFYFAQLFEDGVLTQTKRTAKDSSTETTRMGGSVKILSGDYSGADLVERGLERLFDPSWLAPIEVLNRLDEFQFVHRDLATTPIGGLFLVPGEMSIIDIRMLKELWPDIGEMVLRDEINAQNLAPKLKQRALSEGKKSYETVAKVLKNLPHAIQATFISSGELLWSTLRSESMLINPDDLALKHGALIPGEWHVLGVLDAQPGETGALLHDCSSALDEAMVQMLAALRGLMGRPTAAYGVTPIAIFRAVRPAVN